jgi:hypothetical protein
MASELLSLLGSNERGQNRLSDASCLHGDVHPFRSLDLEWPVPVAGKNVGRSELTGIFHNAAKPQPKAPDASGNSGTEQSCQLTYAIENQPTDPPAGRYASYS